MAILVALLLLAGALVLLLVRTAPAPARTAAWLAMAALALAALAPPRSEAVTVPARIGIASGAPLGSALEQGLQAEAERDGRAAELAFANAPALPAALARAAMRAGPRAAELLAVWNAPIDAVAPLRAPIAGAAYTTTPPLPFAPEALELRVASAARADRPLQFAASVSGASAPLAATVTIAPNGGAATAVPVTVPTVGAAAVVAGAPPAGPCTVAIELEVDGHRVRRSGRVEVEAQQRVLVLEPSGTIAAALAAQGVAVEAATALPADLGPWAAVVLGAPLPPADQERLAAAVDEGLGVFALGPGLQAEREPLRALWPLTIRSDGAGAGAGGGPPRDDAPPPVPPEPRDPPEPPPGEVHRGESKPEAGGPVEVDRHDIAMVFVVDRSSSMGDHVLGGPTKMSFVKTSALRTAEALADGDQVGIVTFGNQDQGRVELPLTPTTDRARVREGIERLAHAKEATFLLAGLRAAQAQLAVSRAAVRHVVVLTDGEFYDPVTAVRSLAHDMLRTGVTVSIVSIIDPNTDAEFLRNSTLVAQDGGGVFLTVTDPRSVPQLVSAEVVRTLSRVGRSPQGSPEPSAGDVANATPPPPVEVPPTPPTQPEANEPPPPARLAVIAVAPSSPLLAPAVARWPDLRGVVANHANADAQVLLVAGDEGVPVLAYGNRGLGRVGVFAADLGGDDGASFRAEAAFPARLAQWIAALLPPQRTLPASVLVATEVEPPLPLPREVAQLEAVAGPLLPFAGLTLPPPRLAFAVRSQVPTWAGAAVLALVLLAAIEWWLARRTG